MFEDVVLKIDPFLRRKIEIVAMEHEMTFAEAVIFLCSKVITPKQRDVPLPSIS